MLTNSIHAYQNVLSIQALMDVDEKFIRPVPQKMVMYISIVIDNWYLLTYISRGESETSPSASLLIYTELFHSHPSICLFSSVVQMFPSPVK